LLLLEQELPSHYAFLGMPFFPVKKYQGHTAKFLLIKRGIPTGKSIIERKEIY